MCDLQDTTKCNESNSAVEEDDGGLLRSDMRRPRITATNDEREVHAKDREKELFKFKDTIGARLTSHVSLHFKLAYT